MSAPLGGGLGLDLRQAYVETRHHEPTGALLKALLINGSRFLDSDNTIPNCDEGFGALNLHNSLNHLITPPGMIAGFKEFTIQAKTEYEVVGFRFPRDSMPRSNNARLRVTLLWKDGFTSAALNTTATLYLKTYVGRSTIAIGNGSYTSSRLNNVQVVEKPVRDLPVLPITISVHCEFSRPQTPNVAREAVWGRKSSASKEPEKVAVAWSVT